MNGSFEDVKDAWNAPMVLNKDLNQGSHPIPTSFGLLASHELKLNSEHVISHHESIGISNRMSSMYAHIRGTMPHLDTADKDQSCYFEKRMFVNKKGDLCLPDTPENRVYTHFMDMSRYMVIPDCLDTQDPKSPIPASIRGTQSENNPFIYNVYMKQLIFGLLSAKHPESEESDNYIGLTYGGKISIDDELAKEAGKKRSSSNKKERDEAAKIRKMAESAEKINKKQQKIKNRIEMELVTMKKQFMKEAIVDARRHIEVPDGDDIPVDLMNEYKSFLKSAFDIRVSAYAARRLLEHKEISDAIDGALQNGSASAPLVENEASAATATAAEEGEEDDEGKSSNNSEVPGGVVIINDSVPPIENDNISKQEDQIASYDMEYLVTGMSECAGFFTVSYTVPGKGVAFMKLPRYTIDCEMIYKDQLIGDQPSGKTRNFKFERPVFILYHIRIIDPRISLTRGISRLLEINRKDAIQQSKQKKKNTVKGPTPFISDFRAKSTFDARSLDFFHTVKSWAEICRLFANVSTHYKKLESEFFGLKSTKELYKNGSLLDPLRVFSPINLFYQGKENFIAFLKRNKCAYILDTTLSLIRQDKNSGSSCDQENERTSVYEDDLGVLFNGFYENIIKKWHIDRYRKISLCREEEFDSGFYHCDISTSNKEIVNEDDPEFVDTSMAVDSMSMSTSSTDIDEGNDEERSILDKNTGFFRTDFLDVAQGEYHVMVYPNPLRVYRVPVENVGHIRYLTTKYPFTQLSYFEPDKTKHDAILSGKLSFVFPIMDYPSSLLACSQIDKAAKLIRVYFTPGSTNSILENTASFLTPADYIYRDYFGDVTLNERDSYLFRSLEIPKPSLQRVKAISDSLWKTTLGDASGYPETIKTIFTYAQGNKYLGFFPFLYGSDTPYKFKAYDNLSCMSNFFVNFMKYIEGPPINCYCMHNSILLELFYLPPMQFSHAFGLKFVVFNHGYPSSGKSHLNKQIERLAIPGSISHVNTQTAQSDTGNRNDLRTVIYDDMDVADPFFGEKGLKKGNTELNGRKKSEMTDGFIVHMCLFRTTEGGRVNIEIKIASRGCMVINSNAKIASLDDAAASRIFPVAFPQVRMTKKRRPRVLYDETTTDNQLQLQMENLFRSYQVFSGYIGIYVGSGVIYYNSKQHTYIARQIINSIIDRMTVLYPSFDTLSARDSEDKINRLLYAAAVHRIWVTICSGGYANHPYLSPGMPLSARTFESIHVLGLMFSTQEDAYYVLSHLQDIYPQSALVAVTDFLLQKTKNVGYTPGMDIADFRNNLICFKNKYTLGGSLGADPSFKNTRKFGGDYNSEELNRAFARSESEADFNYIRTGIKVQGSKGVDFIRAFAEGVKANGLFVSKHSLEQAIWKLQSEQMSYRPVVLNTVHPEELDEISSSNILISVECEDSKREICVLRKWIDGFTRDTERDFFFTETGRTSETDPEYSSSPLQKILEHSSSSISPDIDIVLPGMTLQRAQKFRIFESAEETTGNADNTMPHIFNMVHLRKNLGKLFKYENKGKGRVMNPYLAWAGNGSFDEFLYKGFILKYTTLEYLPDINKDFREFIESTEEEIVRKKIVDLFGRMFSLPATERNFRERLKTTPDSIYEQTQTYPKREIDFSKAVYDNASKRPEDLYRIDADEDDYGDAF